MRSPRSATFVVRNSKLCRARIRYAELENTDYITLFSNDPAHTELSRQPGVPKCVDLPKLSPIVDDGVRIWKKMTWPAYINNLAYD